MKWLESTKNSPKPISNAEVNTAIKNLNSKSTFDQHGLSNILIKAVPICFRIHIVTLFNKILETNKFPAEWKKSEMFMLPKKPNDRNNIKNYRPISITSC